MGEDILMTFQDVLSFTGAELLQGNTDLPIKGVCTDTRTIQNGDLFIALPGARFHGDDFAHKALEKGAVAVLVSGKPHQISMKKASIAIVSDGLKALWALAKGYRSKLDIPLIAITGSSGKTTTKDMLYTILNDQYPVFRTFQNFNNHIGVCLSILQIRNHHRVACLELGSNAPGEIDALASLVKPDIGIILNVGPTHLEKLRDLEGVCREKTDLFRHAKRGVYNKDDVVLEAHISRGEFNARSFGIYQGGDVRATGIEVCDDCTTQFNLIIDQNECGLVRI
ncbi:MAG: UDP-N-acetylmuramoyl-tripeptide--D-alanyl-D-alanine ligase, partial [Chlamydiota bacterium]|nr:UDP-N-acetylmuramoyl-tripeptide--D-alanyl-D-alanine ligase [Chlamydiota bacterium]